MSHGQAPRAALAHGYALQAAEAKNGGAWVAIMRPDGSPCRVFAPVRAASVPADTIAKVVAAAVEFDRRMVGGAS